MDRCRSAFRSRCRGGRSSVRARSASCRPSFSFAVVPARLTREDRRARGRTSTQMGSRLLPLSLALGAFAADAVGLHHIAYYLVLLAVVGAAAAAFVGVGEWLEGKGGLARAGTTTLALVLL